MSRSPTSADWTGRQSEGLSNCMVEASAGTGKTRELVKRIVAAVVEGCGIEHIVAVTFTHAAAGEMKLRLRQELDKARQNPALSIGERERAGEALQHLERAFIGTIHSFCAQTAAPASGGSARRSGVRGDGPAEAYALFGRNSGLDAAATSAAPACFTACLRGSRGAMTTRWKP